MYYFSSRYFFKASEMAEAERMEPPKELIMTANPENLY